MAQHDSDQQEVDVVLTPETIQFINERKNELVAKLVSITPDPSNPTTLSNISALQGHIRGLDEVLEAHNETIDNIRERGES